MYCSGCCYCTRKCSEASVHLFLLFAKIYVQIKQGACYSRSVLVRSKTLFHFSNDSPATVAKMGSNKTGIRVPGCLHPSLNSFTLSSVEHWTEAQRKFKREMYIFSDLKWTKELEASMNMPNWKFFFTHLNILIVCLKLFQITSHSFSFFSDKQAPLGITGLSQILQSVKQCCPVVVPSRFITTTFSCSCFSWLLHILVDLKANSFCQTQLRDC